MFKIKIKSSLISLSILVSFWNLEVSAQEIKVTKELSSHRMTFPLFQPRRFSTRYLKENRTVQIRISPASVAEFSTAKNFDSQYIKSLIVESDGDQVTLNYQLKNHTFEWIVLAQENPWRLVFDLWKSKQSGAEESLKEQWNSQETALGGTDIDSTSGVVDIPQISAIPSASQLKPPSMLDKVTESISSTPVQASVVSAGRSVPNNPTAQQTDWLGRFDLQVTNTAKIAEFEQALAKSLGTPDEASRLADLAQEHYATGRFDMARKYFRRMILVNESLMRGSDRSLWQAAESSYLENDMSGAKEYLDLLALHHNKTQLASFGRLRQLDLGEYNATELVAFSKNKSEQPLARAAAILRVVSAPKGSAVLDAPALALLETCTADKEASRAIARECGVTLVASLLQSSASIQLADVALQRFVSLYPNDIKENEFKQKLQERVRTAFAAAKQDPNTWTEVGIRPELLEFTLGDEVLLSQRIGYLEKQGEKPGEKQGQGASLAVLVDKLKVLTSDENKRLATYAKSARIAADKKNTKETNKNLDFILNSAARKKSGLGTNTAMENIKALSLKPFLNPKALRILLEEIKSKRYQERDFETLIGLISIKNDVSFIDNLTQLVPANQQQSDTQMKILMAHADRLKLSGRYERAADIYLVVASLPFCLKKAESAYRSGVMYARVEKLEQARKAWQISVLNTDDKRFSSLSQERLDRLNERMVPREG